MIYCVIPRELEADLYGKLVRYYEDTPGVTVVVARHDEQDRHHRERPSEGNKRVLRGCLRRHTIGTDAGPSSRRAGRDVREGASLLRTEVA
jgi:hypothetical protein